ncbi:head GIN domain-containing protein [Spirosoma endophyticum]|uniref:Putative auto-transporter adhesin, head GIN domain n=1 Tax=Spirosoma endophyticum TaxID=662367 RepID=A0A1I2A7M4_9BACT|nr:head GIN domain-containing protein [Spirosoma endophyticum]SFE40094.1 Putative auto-transporter adhesin, head GIN domain [Spirosoma endophyticum]
MKALVLSILMLTAGINTTSDDWKKDRTVSGFTGLSVSSGIDVYLTQGNSEKLTFDVKGVDEDRVISEVKNGVLKLYIERKGFSGWNLGRNNYVKAYVTFKQLNNLEASGGADVFGQGSLSFKDLNLEASGGSDVKLDLKADDLNVSASGGADAVLQGSARTLNANGSGGADLDARKLTVDVCNANSSGGSDVYVNASKELTMKASGGSDIYYYGSAKVLSQSKSGGSDISRK